MMNQSLTEKLWGFNEGKRLRILPPRPDEMRPMAPPKDPEACNSVRPVEVLGNGDVAIRTVFRDAAGKRITVESAHLAVWHFCQEMHPLNEDGLYEAILPQKLGLYGNVVVQFRIDGMPVMAPGFPSMYYGFGLSNCFELDDPGAPFTKINQVPHGSVTRELFWSNAMNGYQSCYVYTPPEYGKGGPYPVLYLQHGAGENETAWCANGKLQNIMDNAVFEKKALPFIVVMCDGMVKPSDEQEHEFAAIEEVITSDCRTFIEEKYNVLKDQKSRAIAGLSLGSMQACYIGMRHPDLYSAIGSFTYIRCRDTDNTHDGNPHLDALRDPDTFWKNYRLFFRSIGDQERDLYEFEEDDAFISKCGADQADGYVRRIYPGQIHNWNNWRLAFYDFACLLFRWQSEKEDA